MPRLMMQTLIENAVEHGVAPAGGGRIELNVSCQVEQLVIEVINNGQRLTDEQLARLRSIVSDTKPADGHLGIRNISQRLRLIYGEKAGLFFSIDSHGNTVATIRQPLRNVEQP